MNPVTLMKQLVEMVLKSADHDSMSGEHVGTTSGLIVTSGKSGIWPLEAPENQGFGKL
jgi:hypothetical protein